MYKIQLFQVSYDEQLIKTTSFIYLKQMRPCGTCFDDGQPYYIISQFRVRGHHTVSGQMRLECGMHHNKVTCIIYYIKTSHYKSNINISCHLSSFALNLAIQRPSKLVLFSFLFIEIAHKVDFIVSLSQRKNVCPLVV